MPEQGAARKQALALVMMISALSLGVVAYLIATGTIPLPDELRLIAAVAVGAAAFADFVVGLWFYRMGQSS